MGCVKGNKYVTFYMLILYLYQSAYVWGLFNVKKITLELGKSFYI